MRPQSRHHENAPSQPDSPPTSAAFDTLARMVAHEVRNALSPLRIAAQTAKASTNRGDSDPLASRVIRTIDRVSVITEAILERESGFVDGVHPSNVISGALESCSTWNADDAPRVEFASGDLSLATNSAVLHHIISNLISNAVRVSGGDPSGVSISVHRSTWNSAAGSMRGVAFCVTDNGPGLPQAVLERLSENGDIAGNSFDPWQGGVGLEVVRLLSQCIDAKIEASNRPEGGAQIIIKAPDQLEAASVAA